MTHAYNKTGYSYIVIAHDETLTRLKTSSINQQCQCLISNISIKRQKGSYFHAYKNASNTEPDSPRFPELIKSIKSPVQLNKSLKICKK